MYETFYGLKKKPFQMVPDPAFLYWSEAHLMAFTMLRYGIMSVSPITVITGEVGTGKTTLLRQLLEELSDEDMTVGLVSNMQDGKGELLEWVLMSFDQSLDGSHVARFQRFQKMVVESYAASKRVMLIIDEAQNLGVEQLEELRMLSNINTGDDQLLQIILVGQPELREMLGRIELRQFSQRITSDFHIPALEPDEVYQYVRRRLEIAGLQADREVFPRTVCELIYHATGGVPRLINVLSDLCMVYGFSSESHVITEGLLRDLMNGMERNGIFNQLVPPSSAPTLIVEDNQRDERNPSHPWSPGQASR